MPLATPTPAQYPEILDSAKAGGYAIPAVNVSSSTTLNAAILGSVTAGSDGIVQVSRGGGDFAAGPANDGARGARALADYAAAVAEQVPILVVPHDDPRTWGRSAEQAMAARVMEACHQLGSAGRSLAGHAPRPRRA